MIVVMYFISYFVGALRFKLNALSIHVSIHTESLINLRLFAKLVVFIPLIIFVLLYLSKLFREYILMFYSANN